MTCQLGDSLSTNFLMLALRFEADRVVQSFHLWKYAAYFCIWRSVGLLLQARNSCAFQVEIKLNQEGFGKRVLASESLHCLQQELKRRVHLLVFRSCFEILDENACRYVDGEGYKRIHLIQSEDAMPKLLE
jgi:hypothetical protein